MSNYYSNQEAKVNIMGELVNRGWKVFGFRPDQSDSMTDYWHPAHWEGIATKDGYTLLIDVHSLHYSGYKKTEKGYTPNYARIKKLETLRDNHAATEGEKINCQIQIDKIMKKAESSVRVIEEYPTFKNANPKRNNWHIEDAQGNIIAKGNGAFQCYVSNDHKGEKTQEAVNKFVARIEKAISEGKKVVSKTVEEVITVIKPVEVNTSISNFSTETTFIKLNTAFTHGFYSGTLLKLVRTYNNSTSFTFVRLGKNNKVLKETEKNLFGMSASRLEKFINEGSISIIEFKEVQETIEKTVFVKVNNNVKENTEESMKIESVEVPATEQPTQVQESTVEASYTLNDEKQGIEVIFNSKPPEEVRTQLKSLGFRWSKKGSYWFAKQTSERLAFVKSLVGEQIAEPTQENELELTCERLIDQSTSIYAELLIKNGEMTAEQQEQYVNKLNNYISLNDINVDDNVLNYIKEQGYIKLYTTLEDIFSQVSQAEELENDIPSFIADQVLNNATLDLQFFASSSSILDKFSNITIENEARISEGDQKYCEAQEEMYKSALDAMETALNTFKNIFNSIDANAYDSDYRRGYIDKYDDIQRLEERIKKTKNNFITSIIGHFTKTYNITIDVFELHEKYESIDTYQTLINEIFDQLGGFSFSEKAVQEIKENISNDVHYDKVEVKKNKLIIPSFVYIDHFDKKWGHIKISYSSKDKVSRLFKALSHFETGEAKINCYYEDIQQSLNKENSLYKYELGYEKVQSFKPFQNGKVEIVFQTMQQAEEFKREYLSK
ncbi:hypothetical protein COE51_01145 [Bacillus pseudomycoides]|nr:hypothetical protein COE51_01145 [Bacillus pseudomycoides]